MIMNISKSSPGLKTGENYSQYEPEICTQANGQNDEQRAVMIDIFNWSIPLADNIRFELIKRGCDPSQNKSGSFKTVKMENLTGANRYLSANWFFREMLNRTKVTWMVYSSTGGQLYCFCCRLYEPGVNKNSPRFATEFYKWWKLSSWPGSLSSLFDLPWKMENNIKSLIKKGEKSHIVYLTSRYSLARKI